MKAAARNILLGCCAALFIIAGAQSQSAPPPGAGWSDTAPRGGFAVAKRRIELDVRVDTLGAYAGDVRIGVESDGTVDLPADRAFRLLLPIVHPFLLQELRERLTRTHETRVRLGDFETLRLTASYNASSRQISVELPEDLRPLVVRARPSADELSRVPLPRASSIPADIAWRTAPATLVPAAPSVDRLTLPAGDLTGLIQTAGARRTGVSDGNLCEEKLAQLGPPSGTVIPIPPSAPRLDTPPPVMRVAPQTPQKPGRNIQLIVPFKERSFYIGDITIGIAPDGTVDMPLDRVLELLQPIASKTLIDALKTQAQGRTRLTLDDLKAVKLNAAYDSAQLEVSIVLPLEDRQRRDLELYSLDSVARGQFVPASNASAWLTWRTSFDYVNIGAPHGQEVPAPAIDLTGSVNISGVVLTAGGRFDTGASMANAFQRDYTRLTYDEPAEARRWTLGDLDPAIVGFQTAPDMAGISLLKSYSALQPGRNIRPRGLTSFSLREPGAVEVLINGQLVRRLNLDVGSYDLHDFPFTAGQNNVQLVVEDRTGTRELFSYQQFYDLNLLETGLSEYQLAVGVAAPFVGGQPRYNADRPLATGFLRHGVSDDLTLGVNAQADSHGIMAGWESVWASPVGILGLQLAGSRVHSKDGWALLANFQHQNNPAPGEHRWSFGFNVDARSAWFSTIGDAPSLNDTAVDATAYFSRELGPTTTINLDAGYLWRRGAAVDSGHARIAVYQRIGDTTSLGVEARWDNSALGNKEYGLYFTLSSRLGADQYASASYDTAEDRTRLSWQQTPSNGYDDWSFTADAERTPGTVALNGNVYRQWNRIETSLNHSATIDETGAKITDERTSLRLAGSIAYADGAVAIGRPVYDSFAIVEAHDSLDGHTVRVDPHGDGQTASTDALGPALVPDLSGYSRRTLAVDVAGLPAGYNLDSGSFDVLPPYHGGYRLTVGSDYSISVIGVLDDRDGQPVPLLAGKAYQVARPEDHPIELFTDRKGRFAATGLRPGLWRIELGAGAAYVYDLDVKPGPTLQRLTTPLEPMAAKP